MDGNRKQIIVFIVIVILLTIFLFFPDNEQPETTVSDAGISATESMEQTQETTEEITMSSEEIEKAEKESTETTFWMWQGMESGKSSVEYITLCGDGVYILRIELEDHDPVEETGVYQKLNSEGTKISLPYKQKAQTVEIKNGQFTIAEKVFKQLTESHF